MNKRMILLLALITLIVFPIPSMLTRLYLNDVSPIELMDFGSFKLDRIFLGLEFGVSYALLSIILLRMSAFQEMPVKVEQLIKNMNLTITEGLFISFCAGFGEELLFRAGIQYYLGIVATSVIFIAVHGYFSISTPKNSLYGIVLLPFILLLSYGFEVWGLWFAIAAHFAYDAIIFISMIRDQKISAE
jgi:membrane protease YdiL (CAAX protease family)